ncbi:hypothetical protein DFH06DRAFT_1150448 [Mycena polygramma]|nr:hypothetical protein DFH06DRAFT_1150448 [Mycena polygramma]
MDREEVRVHPEQQREHPHEKGGRFQLHPHGRVDASSSHSLGRRWAHLKRRDPGLRFSQFHGRDTTLLDMRDVHWKWGYYTGGAGGRHLWWPGLGGNIYPASHTQVLGSHSHSTYSPRPTHSSNAATKQAASNPKKYENAAVHAGWGPIGAMSQVQTYGVGKCAVQAPKSENFPARATRGKKV